MGLFKSLKKAIKKIGKGIKKVVKKTVGAVKKVVKKVASSKVLRAVIGGALLFTGVGGVISRFIPVGKTTGFFAKWANAASTFAKGSSALGGIGQVFRPAYNLGQNIFSGAGPFGGQGMFSSPVNPTTGSKLPGVASGSRKGFKSFLGGAAKETGKDLIKAYARQEVFGEDPVGDAAGLSVEPDARLQPIEFAYQNLGVDSNNAYSNLTYGTADLGYISTPLYTQETVNIT